MAESPVTYSGVPTETTAEITSVAIPVSETQPFPANAASYSAYPTPAEAAAGTMKSALTIQPYSADGFIVVGDSRPYRSHLKKYGGEWRKDLTTADGRNIRAWLFPLQQQDKIKDLIERINRGEIERDKNVYYKRSNPNTRINSNIPPGLPTSNGHAAPIRSNYTWYQIRVGQRCSARIDGKTYIGTITQLFPSTATGVVNQAQIDWGGKISEMHIVYNCVKDKLIWRLKDYHTPHSLKFF